MCPRLARGPCDTMAEQPTITFSLFVLSLAASAEIHLGSLPQPGSDKPGSPNLIEASHLIEVIAMLKEKTEGNLDEQEERLIDSVLFDLRMRYVEAAGAKPGPGGEKVAGA
jgi:hypothetical protein